MRGCHFSGLHVGTPHIKEILRRITLDKALLCSRHWKTPIAPITFPIHAFGGYGIRKMNQIERVRMARPSHTCRKTIRKWLSARSAYCSSISARPRPRQAQHAPLPRGIPDRQAGHRMAEGDLVPDPVRHRPQHPPEEVGEAYASIWNKELDESPLRNLYPGPVRQACLALGAHRDVHVDGAMRYGNPSIESRLLALKNRAASGIVIFPLYPQYSAATTATVNDKAFEALMKMRWNAAIRTVPPYHGRSRLHRRLWPARSRSTWLRSISSPRR